MVVKWRVNVLTGLGGFCELLCGYTPCGWPISICSSCQGKHFVAHALLPAKNTSRAVYPISQSSPVKKSPRISPSTLLCACNACGLMFCITYMQIEPLTTFLPAAARLVAIGDLHGDMGKTRRAFRIGGLIDDNGKWSGGTTTAVQVIILRTRVSTRTCHD